MEMLGVDVFDNECPGNRDQSCPNCNGALAKLAWVQDGEAIDVSIEDQAHFGIKDLTVCFDCGESSKDWIL